MSIEGVAGTVDRISYMSSGEGMPDGVQEAIFAISPKPYVAPQSALDDMLDYLKQVGIHVRSSSVFEAGRLAHFRVIAADKPVVEKVIKDMPKSPKAGQDFHL